MGVCPEERKEEEEVLFGLEAIAPTTTTHHRGQEVEETLCIFKGMYRAYFMSIRLEPLPEVLQLLDRRIRCTYVNYAQIINGVLRGVELVRCTVPTLVLVKEKVLSIIDRFLVWQLGRLGTKSFRIRLAHCFADCDSCILCGLACEFRRRIRGTSGENTLSVLLRKLSRLPRCILCMPTRRL